MQHSEKEGRQDRMEDKQRYHYQVSVPKARVSLVFKITSASIFSLTRTGVSSCTCSCTVGKKQVPFRMAIGNVELMHECFPKHSRMGTARMK